MKKNEIEKKFATELEQVHEAIEFENYRIVENIIEKVNNHKFTRYCVTLVIDELISFETDKYSESKDE